VKVPDVTGESKDDAIKALNDAGLTVRTYFHYDDSVPKDVVMGQLPEAGTEVPISTAVGILISAGPSQPQPTPPTPSTVKVPDVTGMSEADANEALKDAGLAGESVPVFSDDVPEGDVVSQYPTAGTEVLLGSDVAIAISQGPEQGDTVEVPDVSEMTGADAKAAIEAAGLEAMMFTTPTPDGKKDDTVLGQLPPAGTTVPEGSPVVVLTANGETGDLDPQPVK
jgi:serine/threonine-protein kinase